MVPETYLITLPPWDGVILDPHPMKPAETADKDENGEKGDPIYQGEAFGATEMLLQRENKLKIIFAGRHKDTRGMASRNNNS
jgi:hypothetical protein